MNKLLKYSFAVSVTSALFCAMMAVIPASTAFASTTNLSGYAWSSTIGWISFSGSTATSSYAVTMDTTTGALGGYAWSNHLGWISFNPSNVSGCPSGSCSPTVNLTTGVVTGWARALTLSSDPNDGTGWISLHGPTGTSTASYGVAYNTTTGQFSGYAWSSDIIGWMEWYLGGSTPSPSPSGGGGGGGGGCDPTQGVCGGGGTNPSPSPNGGSGPAPTCSLTASSVYNPSGSVPADGSTHNLTLSWTSTNATSCAGSGFQVPGGSPNGSELIGATPGNAFGLTCTSGSYPNQQQCSNVHIGTAIVPTAVNLWLNNTEPHQFSALIHPSATLPINWDASQFFAQYPIATYGSKCTGEVKNGYLIQAWNGVPVQNPTALSNSGNAIPLSGFVAGQYTLDLVCTAPGALPGGGNITVTSNPVYITVTTGTIHEQ